MSLELFRYIYIYYFLNEVYCKTGQEYVHIIYLKNRKNVFKLLVTKIFYLNVTGGKSYLLFFS